MLAQKPTDNTMTADNNRTVSPADIFAPSEQIGQEHMQDYADFLKPGDSVAHMRSDMSAYHHSHTSGTSPISPDIRTPELTSSPDFGWVPGDEFLSSPAYTPYEDFLTTPVMGEEGDMFTESTEAALYPANLPLFPDMPSYSMEPLFEKPVVPAAPAFDKLYQMSPVSPALHDFNAPSAAINPASLYESKRFPSDLSSIPSSSTDAPRRKSSATGTRKGVTPEALVPIDAPTQPRKYVTPSATSRKALPTVFARKRTRAQAFNADDEDELLEELKPDATELEQIEYKRRQNTVAARRSRKRKLEYQQKLADDVERLQRGRDMWRERARMLQRLMEARGFPCPSFPDDDDDV